MSCSFTRCINNIVSFVGKAFLTRVKGGELLPHGKASLHLKQSQWPRKSIKAQPEELSFVLSSSVASKSLRPHEL